jgi:hypothetical protein
MVLRATSVWSLEHQVKEQPPSVSTYPVRERAQGESWSYSLPKRPAKSAEVSGALDLSPPCSSSTIYEDNKGALTLATLPRLNPKSKQIAVKHYFFRQYVAGGTVRVVKIDTRDHLADIFTKGLTLQAFEPL